jgi:hypothetical protein
MSFIPGADGNKSIFKDGIQVDHIGENTVGHNIVFDNAVTTDGGKQVYNISGEGLKTGTAYAATGSFADVDATNLKVNLPSAGTYLIISNIRWYVSATTWAVLVARLYNQTLGAEVSNSIRLGFEWGGPHEASINVTTGLTWLVTVSGITELRFQIKLLAGASGGVQADGNGYNTFEYVRLY